METLPFTPLPIETDNTPDIDTMSVADTPPISVEQITEVEPAQSEEASEEVSEITPTTDSVETTIPPSESKVTLEDVHFEAPVRVVDDQGNVSVIIAQLGPDGLIIPEGSYRYDGENVAYVDNQEDAIAERGEQQQVTTTTTQPETAPTPKPVVTVEARELPSTGTEYAGEISSIGTLAVLAGVALRYVSKKRNILN